MKGRADAVLLHSSFVPAAPREIGLKCDWQASVRSMLDKQHGETAHPPAHCRTRALPVRSEGVFASRQQW